MSRRAVSMWDFSWLTRRAPPHAEYADWGRVLTELGERGYDCVRIDAFPHLIAAGPDRRFTVPPLPWVAQWGPRVPVDIEPREALVDFVALARAHGIRVALSTWFCPDASGAAERVCTPTDYVRVWGAALELLDDASLLDAIEYVDLCNEFPIAHWARGAQREIFGTGPRNLLPAVLPWRRAAASRAAGYWRTAIPALRDRFPGLRFTVSSMSLVERQMLALRPAELDLLEAHVWLTDDIPFSVASLGGAAMLQLPGGLPLHRRAAPALLRAAPRHWSARLRRRQERLAARAADLGSPLWTTEGWATVVYDDRGDWSWVKALCAEAVHNAVELGWEGICTSNFSQPHFTGLWADVAWHRELTGAIRAGS